MLVPRLDELVADAARAWGEGEATVRVIVEVSVLQRGIEAIREQLRTEAEQARRMGWPE